MREVFKLTTPDLTTHFGFQWVVGEWRETDGSGGLCGPGWLHHYSSPLVAVLHNPAHAMLSPFKLWRAEARGSLKDDRGLKGGSTGLRLVEELIPVVFTPRQLASYAHLCADAAEYAATEAAKYAAKYAAEYAANAAKYAEDAADAAKYAEYAAAAAKYAANAAVNAAKYAAKYAANLDFHSFALKALVSHEGT